MTMVSGAGVLFDARAEVVATPTRPVRGNGLERVGEEGFAEAEIDEAGAGDALVGKGLAEVGHVEALEDLRGDLARRERDFLGQGHGDVRLIVRELGVAGLDEGIDDVFAAESQADGVDETFAESFFDGLHAGSFGWGIALVRCLN